MVEQRERLSPNKRIAFSFSWSKKQRRVRERKQDIKISGDNAWQLGEEITRRLPKGISTENLFDTVPAPSSAEPPTSHGTDSREAPTRDLLRFHPSDGKEEKEREKGAKGQTREEAIRRLVRHGEDKKRGGEGDEKG